MLVWLPAIAECGIHYVGHAGLSRVTCAALPVGSDRQGHVGERNKLHTKVVVKITW